MACKWLLPSATCQMMSHGAREHRNWFGHCPAPVLGGIDLLLELFLMSCISQNAQSSWGLFPSDWEAAPASCWLCHRQKYTYYLLLIFVSCTLSSLLASPSSLTCAAPCCHKLKGCDWLSHAAVSILNTSWSYIVLGCNDTSLIMGLVRLSWKPLEKALDQAAPHCEKNREVVISGITVCSVPQEEPAWDEAEI